jgi:hypothetical protein
MRLSILPSLVLGFMALLMGSVASAGQLPDSYTDNPKLSENEKAGSKEEIGEKSIEKRILRKDSFIYKGYIEEKPLTETSHQAKILNITATDDRVTFSDSAGNTFCFKTEPWELTEYYIVPLGEKPTKSQLLQQSWKMDSEVAVKALRDGIPSAILSRLTASVHPTSVEIEASKRPEEPIRQKLADIENAEETQPIDPVVEWYQNWRQEHLLRKKSVSPEERRSEILLKRETIIATTMGTTGGIVGGYIGGVTVCEIAGFGGGVWGLDCLISPVVFSGTVLTGLAGGYLGYKNNKTVVTLGGALTGTGVGMALWLPTNVDAILIPVVLLSAGAGGYLGHRLWRVRAAAPGSRYSLSPYWSQERSGVMLSGQF